MGLLTLAVVAMVAPAAASAQNNQFGVPANEWNLAEGTEGGLVGAISEIIGFIASLLAVLAILVIIIAGIIYITSGGDEGRIATAKSWITYAIVGLVIALLAWVIVNAVSAGLGVGAGGGGDGGVGGG